MMQHWQDAMELGLDRHCRLLTTTGGGAEIGICMENIPDDLRLAISRCTVIIAKGMANFESLSEMDNLPPCRIPDGSEMQTCCRRSRGSCWIEDRAAQGITSRFCCPHFASVISRIHFTQLLLGKPYLHAKNFPIYEG